ncbi:hypothetical protein Vadar_023821 [Vaccinium darrowii]|uniref:Uncharacterized protein n=1 Tax=Vaccinium darrowii TaxID=229202 RepID=A0ACB7XJG0_9ERIC|nr:hypothetical protein Vadar_023821 [Vaccinium darrowii]
MWWRAGCKRQLDPRRRRRHLHRLVILAASDCVRKRERDLRFLEGLGTWWTAVEGVVEGAVGGGRCGVSTRAQKTLSLSLSSQASSLSASSFLIVRSPPSLSKTTPSINPPIARQIQISLSLSHRLQGSGDNGGWSGESPRRERRRSEPSVQRSRAGPECVSEFISFVTSEASDKCQKEKRKTINGDDLLWAMATLGFEDYIDPLKSYLTRVTPRDLLGVEMDHLKKMQWELSLLRMHSMLIRILLVKA